MSDVAKANGHIQAEPEVTTHHEHTPDLYQQSESAWSASAAVLRLLLGVALEGGDELVTRLRQWEAAVHTAPPRHDWRVERTADLARYTAVGIMIESQARIRRLLLSVWDVSDEITYRARAEAGLMLRRWPFSLLRPRVDELVLDWEEAVDRWTALGRQEELQGRQVARQAVVSLIDSLLDYMAKNPEVRELIEQQSVSLAGTAVDGVRERAASADALVERLVHTLLRRPSGTRTAEPIVGPPMKQSPAQNG